MYRITTALLTVTAALSLPAIGQAHSITFGHRIDHAPNTASPCVDNSEPTDLSITCTRIPVDATSGGAVAAGMTAPAKGRITKFRIRAVQAGPVTFRVVRMQNGFAKAVGKATTVSVNGPVDSDDDEYPVQTFPASVKVKKGDYVGITSNVAPALYCSHGGQNQLLFTPALSSAFELSSGTDSCELLVQAVMKKKS